MVINSCVFLFLPQTSRFWGMGGIRASKRRSAKRLSLARSLDDLEVGNNFFVFSKWRLLFVYLCASGFRTFLLDWFFYQWTFTFPNLSFSLPLAAFAASLVARGLCIEWSLCARQRHGPICLVANECRCACWLCGDMHSLALMSVRAAASSVVCYSCSMSHIQLMRTPDFLHVFNCYRHTQNKSRSCTLGSSEIDSTAVLQNCLLMCSILKLFWKP